MHIDHANVADEIIAHIDSFLLWCWKFNPKSISTQNFLACVALRVQLLRIPTGNFTSISLHPVLSGHNLNLFITKTNKNLN